MSFEQALLVLLAVAVLALYLGLASVHAQLRSLRTELAEARQAPLDLASVPVPEGYASAQVLALLDSSCASCEDVADVLAQEPADGRTVIVTWEDTADWTARYPQLPVVRAPQTWSALSDLSPPVLVRLDGGRATDVVLPVGPDEARRQLRRWRRHHEGGHRVP